MLAKLQEEVRAWVARNFTTNNDWMPLLSAVEEMGELCHAHLKAHGGIRIDEDHAGKKIDAIGDVVIALAHYCANHGIDFEAAVNDTWATVQRRNWRENPVDGREAVPADKVYNSWSELLIAQRSGELADRAQALGVGKPVLEMDNDECRMHIGGMCVFRAGGPDDIVYTLLELLGLEACSV